MNCSAIALVAAVEIGLCVEQGAQPLPAMADPDWDRVFARTQGWTGGDAVYSIDLRDGRVLWLFADTWIGRIENGRHLPGSKLVNNSLAMHALPRAGQPPAVGEVRFLWGSPPGAKNPLAWIRPKTNAKELPTGTKPDWYWVADGIVAGDQTASSRLIIFLWRIARTSAPGIMSFRSSGGAIAIIDNPRDDWESWKVRQIVNPHAIAAGPAGGQIDETSWGSEVVLVREPKAQEFLYVYGCRESGRQKQLVLARVPPAKIDDFTAWEFRTTDGWSPAATEAASLANGIANEYSVTLCQLDNRDIWVLIHSEAMLGERIIVRLAESPRGPWSAPRPIYRVPGLDRNKNYFTYAANAHPELSRPGELLISYVINSFDFGAMVNDADIYRPRFVRLPLSALAR